MPALTEAVSTAIHSPLTRSIPRGAIALQKIFTSRGKDIDNRPRLQRHHTMFDARRHEKAIARLERFGHTSDRYAEPSPLDQRRLRMGVTVRRPFGTRSEFDLDHHDPVVVAHYEAPNPSAQVTPFGRIGADKNRIVCTHPSVCYPAPRRCAHYHRQHFPEPFFVYKMFSRATSLTTFHAVPLHSAHRSAHTRSPYEDSTFRSKLLPSNRYTTPIITRHTGGSY